MFPFHKIINIDDQPTEDLYKYFDEIYDFMEQSRKKTNILVHCFAGVSRSATGVIMYLMKKNDWSYYKAYSHCKKNRSIISPNKGIYFIFINKAL